MTIGANLKSPINYNSSAIFCQQLFHKLLHCSFHRQKIILVHKLSTLPSGGLCKTMQILEADLFYSQMHFGQMKPNSYWLSTSLIAKIYALWRPFLSVDSVQIRSYLTSSTCAPPSWSQVLCKVIRRHALNTWILVIYFNSLYWFSDYYCQYEAKINWCYG